MTLSPARTSAVFGLVSLCLTLSAACSSEPEPGPAGGGSGGTRVGATTGGSPSGGSTLLPGGTGGVGGTVVPGVGGTGVAGGGGSAGSGGGAANQAGVGGGGMNAGGAGGGSTGGAGGSGGSTGGVGGKVPMCITSKVQDGVDRASKNYIECDVEDQGIDFDVMAAYPAPRKPGYDPATTPVSFTDYGTAFTGSAAQECHPYCYKGNLTLGVEFAPGAETSLRGEVLFGFPGTVAPIANASGRLSLGWVFLDGPALPAGSKVTVQMVLKSTDKPPVLGNGTHDLPVGTWVEFKYFPIQQGFQAADLVNVTHIGFRATISPAPAQAWSGVIYADHFQLRQ